MDLKLKIKIKADVTGPEEAVRCVERMLAEASQWLKEEILNGGPGTSAEAPLPQSDLEAREADWSGSVSIKYRDS